MVSNFIPVFNFFNLSDSYFFFLLDLSVTGIDLLELFLIFLSRVLHPIRPELIWNDVFVARVEWVSAIKAWEHVTDQDGCDEALMTLLDLPDGFNELLVAHVGVIGLEERLLIALVFCKAV